MRSDRLAAAFAFSTLVWAAGPPHASASDPDWHGYVMSRPEREIFPVAIVEAQGGSGEISDAAALLARDGRSATLAPGSTGGEAPSVVVDFGRLVEGRLEVLREEGDRGDLDVETAECRRFLGPGGEAGELARALRYVRLRSSPGKRGGGRARIDSVSVVREDPRGGGPGSYAGWFLSSDERLNRIWYAGAYTVELCAPAGAGGVVVDGARRDREIWAADLAISIPIWGAFRSDWTAVRRSIVELGIRQAKDGRIPASSMRGFGMRLFDYTAWWVVALRDYVLRSGDVAILEEMLPRVGRALAWYDGFAGPGGLVRKPEAEMEWCYTIARDGALSYENALIALAYGAAADLEGWAGRDGASRAWGDRARALAGALGNRLWDADRGHFVTGDTDRRRVSLDGNVLAVSALARLAPELPGGGAAARVSKALDAIRRGLWTPFGTLNVDLPYAEASGPEHGGRVWPWLVYLEADARFEAGRDEEAIDLLRRTWGRMLEEDPASTFWEWVGRDGRPERPHASLAHAWSAGATALLTERVLGVRAVAPGRYRVEPRPVDLDWARGVVPAGDGEIRVSWRRPAGGEPEIAVETSGEVVVEEVRGAALKRR